MKTVPKFVEQLDCLSMKLAVVVHLQIVSCAWAFSSLHDFNSISISFYRFNIDIYNEYEEFTLIPLFHCLLIKLLILPP